MTTTRTRKKAAEEIKGTTSLWVADQMPEKRPPLRASARADICIIGGGIAGLTTAYLLGREARRVLLIDSGPLTAGETSRTTAHLSNAIDDRFWWIEKVHGQQGARLAAESHSAAIDRIESIVREEGIDCGFGRLDGYLFNPPQSEAEDLEKELAAAHGAGLTGVELLDGLPGGLFPSSRCLRFPRQGQFHPLRYLSALARAIESGGGRIHTGTTAKSVQGGSPVRVDVGKGVEVTADAVVVATNVPIHTRVAIHAKQAAYRTYALALAVAPGSVPEALYWDTLSPYHYVRTAGSGAEELLIVGGEDHKTGQEEDPSSRMMQLEAWAREHFPAAGPVRYGWSGQVIETADGLAFIGRSSGDEHDNVLLVTGDSGMGMTHGTIAGILLTDLIQGRDNPWAKLYDPSRRSLRAVAELAKENLNAAAQYADFLAPTEVKDASDIPVGSGAILQRGVHKIAAFRDEKGKITERSAICPHLGCVVAWNGLEKSWDCPCHGSRFDGPGDVLNGPSNIGLGPADD